MAYNRVLLTGASGSLGAVILEQLLERDAKVIAAVRSLSKTKLGFEKLWATQIKSGQLELVEIPDMTVPGVFHEHAKKVDAVIHVATPLAQSDFVETLIKPTWRINENIFKASEASGTVKRVVITGTIAAVMRFPDQLFSNDHFSDATWNSISFEEAKGDLMGAYQYAKTVSEKQSWEYIKQEKRNFDLVFLLAPAITGKSIQPGYELNKEHLGGTGSVYRELFDRKEPGFIIPYFMDVEDVAIHHIMSLDRNVVPGNERYLIRSRDMMSGPRLALKIREKYPELKDRIPEGADIDSWPTPFAKLDISKAEKVFGSNWKSAWESAEATVKDVISAGI